MNYLKHYINLINNAKSRSVPISDKTHKHHIIPRSLEHNTHCINVLQSIGNIKETCNLLIREHFIAHLLLVRIFDEKSRFYNKYCYSKMVFACNKMNISYIKNNKDYEWVHRDFIKSITGEGNPNFGKIASIETRQKMSIKQKGKPKSDEFKKIVSNKLKGVKLGHPTDEHIKKNSDAHKNKKYSNEINSKKGKCGSANAMYKKSVLDIWKEKYGEQIAINMWQEKYKKTRETKNAK